MKLVSVANFAIATASFTAAAPQFSGYDLAPQAYNYGLNPYGHRDCKPTNRWTRCCNLSPVFSNYANVLAINETVPNSKTDPARGLLEFNTTDTYDWTINSLNRSEVIARNPGVWSINIGVQTFNSEGIASVDGDVAVQLYINGDMISEMKSGADRHSVNSYFNLASAKKLNYGDRLQVAVITNRTNGVIFASDGRLTLTKVPEPKV